MTKTTWHLAFAAGIGLALTATAGSADVIKVGVVAPFSGPFAVYGQEFRGAIDTWVAQHGKMAGSHEVQFIFKDSGGPNPAAAKSATQELLIRDGVKYLAGYVFTPNALAAAPLASKAHVPTVIWNAATSIITTKSPEFIRTSFTLPQAAMPMADWAIAHGIKSVVIAVSDYGPGIDADKAFAKEFTAKGGTILDEIRMPVNTTDFSPFMQRIKSKAPNALFSFIPAGPPAFSFVKSYSDYGLKAAGIKFLGTGDLVDETELQGIGDAGIGVITAHHYSVAHDSAANKAFLAAFQKAAPNVTPNFAAVGAYDGMRVLYKMIEAGGTDGAKALKSVIGTSWESPRGPVTIDPRTRSLTQNMYIREVVKGADGKLENKEIDTIKDVPDLGLVSK
ncbi:MAG: ABC transporter substrate-binding protein [Paracoccaceae bacterium]|nr:ABC transporter substrate-binding protein [Paracoccaceae bacterium]